MMIRCDNCNGENLEDARFCIDCGKPLVVVTTGPTTVLRQQTTTAAQLTPAFASGTPTRLPVVVTTILPPSYAQVGVAAFLLGFVAMLVSGFFDVTSIPAPGGAFTIGFFTGLGISIGAKMGRWGWLPWWGGVCGLGGWALYVTYYVLMKLIWP